MAKKNQNVQGATVNQADPVNVPEKGSFIAGKVAAAKGVAGRAGSVIGGGIGATVRNFMPALYSTGKGLVFGTALGVGTNLVAHTAIEFADSELNTISFKKGLLGKKQEMKLMDFRTQYGCVIPTEELTGKVGQFRKVDVSGPFTRETKQTFETVADGGSVAIGIGSTIQIARNTMRDCNQKPTCTSQEFFDQFNAYANNSGGCYEEEPAEEFVEGGVQ